MSGTAQIASIFNAHTAGYARAIEALGDLKIIPVEQFPRGAPVVNDVGAPALFAVLASHDVIARLRRHDYRVRRGCREIVGGGGDLMCSACGNMCCGSDMFGGCGCDGCDEPACWDGDGDFDQGPFEPSPDERAPEIHFPTERPGFADVVSPLDQHFRIGAKP